MSKWWFSRKVRELVEELLTEEEKEVYYERIKARKRKRAEGLAQKRWVKRA